MAHKRAYPGSPKANHLHALSPNEDQPPHKRPNQNQPCGPQTLYGQPSAPLPPPAFQHQAPPQAQPGPSAAMSIPAHRPFTGVENSALVYGRMLQHHAGRPRERTAPHPQVPVSQLQDISNGQFRQTTASYPPMLPSQPQIPPPQLQTHLPQIPSLQPQGVTNGSPGQETASHHPMPPPKPASKKRPRRVSTPPLAPNLSLAVAMNDWRSSRISDGTLPTAPITADETRHTPTLVRIPASEQPPPMPFTPRVPTAPQPAMPQTASVLDSDLPPPDQEVQRWLNSLPGTPQAQLPAPPPPTPQAMMPAFQTAPAALDSNLSMQALEQPPPPQQATTMSVFQTAPEALDPDLPMQDLEQPPPPQQATTMSVPPMVLEPDSDVSTTSTEALEWIGLYLSQLPIQSPAPQLATTAAPEHQTTPVLDSEMTGLNLDVGPVMEEQAEVAQREEVPQGVLQQGPSTQVVMPIDRQEPPIQAVDPAMLALVFQGSPTMQQVAPMHHPGPGSQPEPPSQGGSMFQPGPPTQPEALLSAMMHGALAEESDWDPDWDCLINLHPENWQPPT